MCFGIQQLRDSVEKSILPNKLCLEIASSNAPPGPQRNTFESLMIHYILRCLFA